MLRKLRWQMLSTTMAGRVLARVCTQKPKIASILLPVIQVIVEMLETYKNLNRKQYPTLDRVEDIIERIT